MALDDDANALVNRDEDEIAYEKHTAASIKRLSDDQINNWISHLTDDEAYALKYEWKEFWARPDQIAPKLDGWLVWLLLAGRGFGKTRTGAEWVRNEVEEGGARIIGLIGPTIADVRDVMIGGESGILACSPEWNLPTYEPSKRHKLTWPNGAIAYGYSADEPERLRGPQHDRIWADETAAWRYQEAWDMAMFGLRLGDDPRACVTTTPRPIKLIRDLIAAKSTRMAHGRTLDNKDNLAQAFFDNIVTKYENTRLGRQELDAEMLEDIQGALWTNAQMDAVGFRLTHEQKPEMLRIVVSLDPSGTKGQSSETSYTNENKSNDVGIVVGGKGIDGHGYVMEDLTLNASPAVWGLRAVEAYHRHKADCILAERNFGGAMVEHVIRSIDRNVRYKEVTASRGKVVRAEPIAGLYEQKRIHHIGAFPLLETQMTQMTTQGYVGDGSPDRVDAMVWCFTELLLNGRIAPTAQVGRAGYVR